MRIHRRHGKKQRKEGKTGMESTTLIAMASIVTAGITMGIGAIGPALGQGRAVQGALSSMAQQPDERNSLTRTLFVGLAMIESIAIYCFVISMILVFANPFWTYVVKKAGG
jgi:F-type H+-transporting ATPase subunit c